MSLEDRSASAASRPIALLIVDDHPLMRGGLRKLIELEADMKVLAEAATAKTPSSSPNVCSPMWCCWISTCPP